MPLQVIAATLQNHPTWCGRMCRKQPQIRVSIAIINWKWGMCACVCLGQFLGFREWAYTQKSSHSKLFISFALFLLFPSRVRNVCWDTMGGSAELCWEAVDCVCWRCEEPLHRALATKAFGMRPWLTLFAGSISHAPGATDRQGWGLNTRRSYWKVFVLFISSLLPHPPLPSLFRKSFLILAIPIPLLAKQNTLFFVPQRFWSVSLL